MTTRESITMVGTVALVALSVVSSSAIAANWVEPGGVDSNWTTAANWNAAVPNGVDAVAVFGSGGGAAFPAALVVVDSVITVGHLTAYEGRFGNIWPAGTFTGAGSITFQVSSGNASLTFLQSWTESYHEFFMPLTVFNSAVDVAGGPNNNGVSFNNGISGSGNLNITNGIVAVASASSYSGDVTVSGSGVLSCSSIFGTSVTIKLQNGGTWRNPYLGNAYQDRRLYNNNIVLLGGTGNITQEAKPANHDCYHWIFTTISGPGQLTIDKAGVGTTTWGAIKLADHPTTGPNPNTYSGGTVIKGTASDSSDVASDLGQIIAAKNGTFGSGNVTMSGQNWLTIGATNTINDLATLTIAGNPNTVLDPETGNGAFLLDMRANEKVAVFIVNGVKMSNGTYGKTGSGATYTGYNAQLGFDLDRLFNDSFGNGGLFVLNVEPPPPSGTIISFK